MDRENQSSDRGPRVERTTRIAGVLLLVSAVLASYLNDYVLIPRQPGWMMLTYSYALPAKVLAPAGAMLIATSLAVRALIRPFSNPSARGQLVAGLAMLAVGLLQLWLGPTALHALTDLLGATANAGVLVAEALARILGYAALPLGIALLATQPLIRLAATMQAQAVSGRPPDIESLD